MENRPVEFPTPERLHPQGWWRIWSSSSPIDLHNAPFGLIFMSSFARSLEDERLGLRSCHSPPKNRRKNSNYEETSGLDSILYQFHNHDSWWIPTMSFYSNESSRFLAIRMNKKWRRSALELASGRREDLSLYSRDSPTHPQKCMNPNWKENQSLSRLQWQGVNFFYFFVRKKKSLYCIKVYNSRSLPNWGNLTRFQNWFQVAGWTPRYPPICYCQSSFG